MGEQCKTKYPIVLIHGAGFRDLKWPVYWGRIPAALEREGAQIYYGLQDCWASIETNAEQIAIRTFSILLRSFLDERDAACCDLSVTYACARRG